MLRDYLNKSSEIVILSHNSEYKISGIKRELLDFLEGSYSTPSLVSAKNIPLTKLIKDGVWVNIHFTNTQSYMGSDFDTIIFAIKPKYDFLTIFRKQQATIIDKCITINLANSSEKILDYIKMNIRKE